MLFFTVLSPCFLPVENRPAIAVLVFLLSVLFVIVCLSATARPRAVSRKRKIDH